jgi:hypothetical protein
VGGQNNHTPFFTLKYSQPKTTSTYISFYLDGQEEKRSFRDPLPLINLVTKEKKQKNMELKLIILYKK